MAETTTNGQVRVIQAYDASFKNKSGKIVTLLGIGYGGKFNHWGDLYLSPEKAKMLCKPEVQAEIKAFAEKFK